MAGYQVSIKTRHSCPKLCSTQDLINQTRIIRARLQKSKVSLLRMRRDRGLSTQPRQILRFCLRCVCKLRDHRPSARSLPTQSAVMLSRGRERTPNSRLTLNADCSTACDDRTIATQRSAQIHFPNRALVNTIRFSKAQPRTRAKKLTRIVRD